jgi:hypothetical protein
MSNNIGTQVTKHHLRRQLLCDAVKILIRNEQLAVVSLCHVHAVAVCAYVDEVQGCVLGADSMARGMHPASGSLSASLTSLLKSSPQIKSSSISEPAV